MSYTIVNTQKEYIELRIDGQFTVQDSLDFQALAAEGWKQGLPYRVLIELGAFQGWSHESGWEDTSLIPDEQHQFSRVAIVGPEKWRVDVHMFTGHSSSSEVFRFFTPDQIDEARVWLAFEYLDTLLS